MNCKEYVETKLENRTKFKLINYRLTQNPWDDASTQFTGNDSDPENEDVDDQEENVSANNSLANIVERSDSSSNEIDLYS